MGCVGVAGDNNHSPRTHVLFLDHHFVDTGSAKIREHLVGMLEIVVSARGSCGCHGRRQMHKPSWVGREAAHDFKGGA